MLSDIEIAQNAKMKHIRDVAASIGIAEDDLEFYGSIRLRLPLNFGERLRTMKTEVDSCYGNKSYSGRRR